MDDIVIRAMGKLLDVWPRLVSGTPGLGSPAGAAWGGVESSASVDASQYRVARVPADGRSANESRSRGSGHWSSGFAVAVQGK
ncbi:MAG TPA: hypothetical protein VN496_01790 [Burkholderiales bacterium]|nr:hypothetical protein [Burkholderiales bacterium]